MSSTPIDSTSPPGGVREAIKSAARPGGAEQGVPDRTLKLQNSSCHNMPNLKKFVFSPPYNPPRRPAHSAGPAQVNRPIRPFFDQNFDHFFTSIFGRFGIVLGNHLGVIFGTFGGQVEPSSVQNAS